MRSAVFYGKHDLRVEEYAMPAVGAKDVLIQVKACGVCGTDVHIYEGEACLGIAPGAHPAAYGDLRAEGRLAGECLFDTND